MSDSSSASLMRHRQERFSDFLNLIRTAIEPGDEAINWKSVGLLVDRHVFYNYLFISLSCLLRIDLSH